MAERKVKVNVVVDTGSLVEFMARVKSAADANLPTADEPPIEWMRRVIDAACWRPDGWDER